MSITAERKAELIQEYKTSENDRGSAQIQIAILTERIRNITDHLRTMKRILRAVVASWFWSAKGRVF